MTTTTISNPRAPLDVGTSKDVRTPNSKNEPRSGKELILATKPYASDSTAKSWYYVISTGLLLAMALAGTVVVQSPLPRLVCSILAGLLTLRFFVIYHDQQHHAILPQSRLAEILMRIFGMYSLSASSVWRSSHNHHHNHNSRLRGSHIGSFPIMTRAHFERQPKMRKFAYLFSRSTFIILFGYFFVFIIGMCITPFRNNPKKHFDCLLSLLLHAAIAGVLWTFLGWKGVLYCQFIPSMLTFAIGSYLFYAQHNFPSVSFSHHSGWTYEKAALESSSYMKTGPVAAWFMANIGYHHIHHLNSKIPFYRLPEAMKGIPELSNPRTTTINPVEIIRCLRLKVWDTDIQKMVGLKHPKSPRTKKKPPKKFMHSPTTGSKRGNQTFTAAEIAQRVKGEVVGDGSIQITGFSSADAATEGDLTFADNEKYYIAVEKSAATAVLASGKYPETKKVVIRVLNPRMAMCELLPLFFPSEIPAPGRDQSASIHASASVDETAHIGPNVIICANVKIGPRCVLMGGNYVGAGSVLLEDVKLFPNVVIYHGTSIGKRVSIHAGTVIGSDGYGYVLGAGKHNKVIQVGTVIIEDDVEIGANNAIDRGALGPTVIGQGTKIDNLVHVAHNVRLGSNCLVMGQVGFAGSTVIGDYSVIASQSGIAGHLKLGKFSTIGAKSGVMRDVAEKEMVLGIPAQPDKQMKRQWIAMQKLPDMMRKFREMEQELEALKAQIQTAG